MSSMDSFMWSGLELCFRITELEAEVVNIHIGTIIPPSPEAPSAVDYR